jgi:hypothetical protein
MEAISKYYLRIFGGQGLSSDAVPGSLLLPRESSLSVSWAPEMSVAFSKAKVFRVARAVLKMRRDGFDVLIAFCVALSFAELQSYVGMA